MTTPRVFAIILAGGRASRMGGIDKPALVVGGRRMLDTALHAAAVADMIVVVGPHRADVTVLQVQEQPAGSGPVAGIAAGLAALAPEPTDRVLIFAADLPWLSSAVTVELLGALDAAADADVAHGVDASGRVQHLLAAWRAQALIATLAGLESPVNQPMRALAPKHAVAVAVSVTDCDTTEDIERARIAGPGVVSVDQARAIIRGDVDALPPCEAVLTKSLGATVASSIHAADAVPHADVSAMDGYAVAGVGPWLLRSEVRPAGDATEFTLDAGEAARIATGAHLPAGATAVLRDEFALVRGQFLSQHPDAPHRDDARRRGEDWFAHHTLVETGAAVTAAVVSTAASSEVHSALVRGPVRVHVVTTGDEIRRDGPLRPGQTRDSLGPVLETFVRATGAVPVMNAHIRDSAASFDELLTNTTDVEVILAVGATGAGAADHLRAALTRADARLLVGRVRCRPGGSLVVASLPDGRVVLGLPGNPFAAVAMLLVALPAVIDGQTLRSHHAPLRGVVTNAGHVSIDRTRIVPVSQSSDGRWVADTAVRTGHLAGLIDRPALALIPPDATDDAVVELVLIPRW